MVVDKSYYYLIFIYYLINLLIITESDILSNPFRMSFSSNPMIKNSEDEIQIYSSNTKYIQNPTTREITSTLSFCPISEVNSLIYNEDTEEYFIFSQSYQYLISISNNNCESKYLSDEDLFPNIEYVGNIYEGSFIPNDFYTNDIAGPLINKRCKQSPNEIILYGKTETDAAFYFVENQKMVTLGVYCTIEDIFSCIKIEHSFYLCVYICSNKINIHIFAYVTEDAEGELCKMMNAYSNSITDGEFTQIMVSETNKEKQILVCAINNDKIQCYVINYTYNEYELEVVDEEDPLNSYYTNKYNITMEYTLTSISLRLDTANNNDCLMKKSLNDEYLICCGGDGIIKCARINNNLELVNSFILNIEGINTNINIIFSSQYLYIFYKNDLDSLSRYYEYSIYKPQCPNIIYSIIPLTSITDDANNLLIRQTTSNYYIKFISYSSSYLNITFNDEFIEDNYTLTETKLIESDCVLKIISLSSESISNLELNYQIILEETFSSLCTAKINILECYHSCKLCSKSKDESSIENHNCLVGGCNNNYYQAPDIETNCWETYEAESNWYLDYIQNRFFYCSDDCPRCDGPTNENCLACRSDSDLKYLYNKKCYEECPDGYYPVEQSGEGYFLCQECFSTCETCDAQGTQYNMNCITCKPNSIHVFRNCFQIEDSTLKTFYNPGTDTISNCLDKYSYYIKDDSNECIALIPEGYYISNRETGVISQCHPDCQTCVEKYTEDNAKCTKCKNEDLNFFNGNCVETCPEGYYSRPKSASQKKECVACYNTCKSCEEGGKFQSGQLKNMNCLQCKKNEDGTDKFIKVNNNCFTIIDYEEDKINFDISLMNSNPSEKIKSCLSYDLSIFFGEYECITKPTNSYYINNEENFGIIKYCDNACSTCNIGKDELTGNTNCLTCSNGYYKTEESDTNCILESLIPINYYKYTEDEIFYKCYELCSKCVRELDYKTDINQMGCDSCIIDYYIEDGTTNCYDISFLDSHINYYLSTDENKFKKCYSSCKTCSIGFVDEYEHNCDECLENYFFEEGTNNCFNFSILEKGYYFDDFSINIELGEKPLFKKCYPNCKTCSNYSIDDNMNCILCKDDFYKIYETNNCIDDITNKGYYGKEGIAYPCNENCLTCFDNSTQITENNLNNNYEIITNISHNCLSCDKENKNLYLVENLNICEPEDFKNMGFYLEQLEDTTKKFKKCHESCSLCDKGLEIDILTGEEKYNCIQCANNYYRLRDDPYENNCYSDEMISKGYRLVRNFWQICYDNCDTCYGSPIFDPDNKLLISQNCQTCYISHNFIYQTNDCENETILEKGYYLDDNDLFYKKCDISCATCNKYSNAENPRCIKCNNDLLYFKAEDKPSDICYNREMIDEGYVLSERFDDEGNSYKIWGFCYEKCVTCLKFGNEEEHGCSSCIPKYYLIYNSTNCVTDNYAVNNGYYFNKTFLKYVQCDESCINCHDGPKEGTTNCKKCNNENGYYSIEGKTNTLCRSEQTIEEGYYLNTLSNPPKWNKCFENCATCEYRGNEMNMKCITCRTNLINNLNKTKYFLLLKGNCIESCENNLYLTKEGDCVEECPEGTYKYNLDYNYTCLNSCPKGYIINLGNNKCELSEFPENVTMSEFKSIVFEKINIYLNSTRIISFDDFKAKILTSSDLNSDNYNSEQIFYINNLENIIDEIKTANNLNNNDEIIIIQTEYNSNLQIRKNLEINKDSINLGKTAEILLYDSLGNKLTIPESNLKLFSITKYIGDIQYIDFTESKWFYEKGIDVFDGSDSFFNDICYPFKTKFNSDVILKDRRNIYFHDVNFCGEYCKYNKIDYSTMNVNCLCNTSLLNKEMNTEIRLVINNNKFPDELYGSNLIVMKCINLIFDSNVIKTNAGFITNMIFISTQIIFFVVFFKNGLKPIQNFILIFEPNVAASPPKLKTLLALAEPKKNKYEEIKKSKLINHLINAKKRRKNSDENEKDDALVINYSENDEDNKVPNSKEKLYNIKNEESEKSESIESKSMNFNEKNTTLKKYKSDKRNKIRNIKAKTNMINNNDKINDKINDLDNGENINKQKQNINQEKLKKYKKSDNLNTINEQYKNKNTEEGELKSKKDLYKEEKGKKMRKNIGKYTNQRKNNNLYSKHDFNFMNYEEAIKKEIKFSEIYWSYLIEFNFILNAIISDSFLNLLTIKINYLCFRLELIFAFNAFLYSDKYISQVFENDGELNFLNSLPKSVYSFLITTVISIGLKFLLNNKKEILDIIQNKNKSEFNQQIKAILIKIKTKLIIYFSIQFSFTLFFLYYCSAFCAVYQNSQLLWIYGCLETILFDIIFSCLFCLFISLCRFFGVKKRIKCLYMMSFIINYI